MRVRLAAGVVSVFLAAACGRQDPLALPDPTDPAARFFDPNSVLEVAVEMEPADWNALRTQSRDVFELLTGVDCMAEPFPSPFTFFPARVTVGGVRRDKVGIRKKGFLGSLDEVKPSLRMKFDEYEAGGNLYGLDHLTLNNSRQDPSYVRQCLAYKVLADAGVPAPRCSFAHVTVNGADMGLYVHVESVDKDLLARHFDDEDGNLYEGTISDFRPEWVNTFARKTNDEDTSRDDLMDVVEALAPAVGDDDLVRRLEQVIDLEAFLDFWAAEVLLAHWDGSTNNTNNFFVYREPDDDRFRFIAWGTDGAMSADPFAGTTPRPLSVYADGELARRLYRHAPTRARYFERLRHLLATVWDEGSLLAELSRMETLITPVIVKATGRSAHRAAIAEVGAFVARRESEILNELARGEPAWNEGPRGVICLKPIGTLEATFSTTYGTTGASNPFAAGTGSLGGTLNAVTVRSTSVGAMAGPDPESTKTPRSVVAVLAVQSDGSVLAAFVVAESFRFSPGTMPLDWGSAVGVLYRIVPGSPAVLVGYLMNGSLTFDQAGTGTGAPVIGRFRGQVISF